MEDVRLSRVDRLLGQHGIVALSSSAGHAHDILALRTPIEALDRLCQLAPELKTLGFAFVTLELHEEEPLVE
jgi:hypothetical protein